MNIVNINEYREWPTNIRLAFVGLVYSLDYIAYLIKGNIHRIDGPAIIYFNRNFNNKNYKEYWINDVEVKKEKQEFLYQIFLESKEDYFDIIEYEKLFLRKDWKSLYED